MAEQLGLQVLVQPHSADPFRFGSAVRAASGSRKTPGAVSLTWIDARSAEEAEQVRAISRPLAAELTKAPGFIGWLACGVANRLYTITAWESEDDVRQVMRSSLHKGAVKRFFTEDFGAAADTGVWSVHHLNPVWVRCTACARVTDQAGSDGTCPCGQPLPEPPAYW
jgi:heme-degrading monooxygenase HmoA